MKTEIKTDVQGLAIGMFVSRLDCAWDATPFLLEGVDIKTREEIDTLRECCSYVYVDVDKGLTPSPSYQLREDPLEKEQAGHAATGQGEKESARAAAGFSGRARQMNSGYSITASFEAELEKAKVIYNDLKVAVELMMTELKAGKHLDVAPVKRVIAEMTESIIRNPAAMMWIISLRKINDNSYSRPLGNSAWCTTFGRHLGLEQSVIETLALGGLLLDIGKVKQSHDLLNKSGPLNEQDKKKMEMHVYLGVKLLEESKQAVATGDISIEVINMVATHHERADGSGYPQGLTNDTIPLFGRIAGIVDSYDAMTSQSMHVNGEPLTPHEAITELYELRKNKYQAELIEQFIRAVGLYPTGSLVELNSGEVGAVVGVHGPGRLRPSMVLLLDKSKAALLRYASLDLSQVGREISVSRGLQFGAFGIDMNELFQ